jgi:hypothetical protein
LTRSTGTHSNHIVDGIDITALSGRYESTGGVASISSGSGDPGGVSYGRHQLSSNAGTMQSFLASEYASEYDNYFDGLRPGTQGFNDAYIAVVEADSAGFENAQKMFIVETHYNPLKRWAEARGFNTSDPGLASALYSISVQHGGWRTILRGIDTSQEIEQIIRDIYSSRTSYINGLNNLPDNWKSGIRDRYIREVEDAVLISRNTQ